MTNILYHYPRCSTCVKAKKWLDEHHISYTAINLADAPPSVEELSTIHESSGHALKKLFNTSGQSYRNGDFKSRLPEMSDAEQLEALAADGMLIKRPLLITGSKSLIGFKLAEWESLIG